MTTIFVIATFLLVLVVIALQRRAIQQGERLMGLSQENKALLLEVRDYTDQLATGQEAENAITAEIGTDVDKLVAALETDDPEVTAILTAMKEKAAANLAAGQARAETLRAIAAKYEDPLPPPVVPVS